MHINRLLLVVIIVSAAIAPSSVQAAKSKKEFAAKCILEVEGKAYINGLCDVSIIDEEGSFILTEKSRRPYFAYIIIDSDDKSTADGTWNGVRGASHAHAPLGSRTMQFRDGCWSNAGARACWSRK